MVSTRAPAKGASSKKYPSASIAKVSTRAPAKGASEHDIRYQAKRKVSTRAPAKGASSEARANYRARIKFQLVPPRRGHLQLDEIPIEEIGRFNSCPREGGIAICLCFFY